MTGTAVIHRADAVAAITEPLADRTQFVIIAGPAVISDLADRLHHIPTGWVAYIDNGLPAVVATDEPQVLALTALLCTCTAVITVPKTVPAAVLTDALDYPVPADGSQDLIVLRSTATAPVIWPLLFIDALELVDPTAAAQIRINDLARLS